MTPLLLALAVVAHPVTVRVLEKLHPARLTLSGPRTIELSASGDRLLVDGTERGDLELPAGRWELRGPGIRPRVYRGHLEARARRAEIELRVQMELEDYVAAVVASETAAGTPPAALRAQAIVVRSYALATRGRHEEADLCDLAHCQVLAGRARREASEAATATEGRVLALPDGSVAAAVFHAACAGHTASPAEVFQGRGRTGAVAVPDPGCGPAWKADVAEAAFARVAGELLGENPLPAEQLSIERGEGGYATRIRDPATGRWAAADALARALDRALGRSAVRSTHFSLRAGGGQVHIEGRGIGHGAGLCQAGAARMARSGATETDILAHYFPDARIQRLSVPAL